MSKSTGSIRRRSELGDAERSSRRHRATPQAATVYLQAGPETTVARAENFPPSLELALTEDDAVRGQLHLRGPVSEEQLRALTEIPSSPS